MHTKIHQTEGRPWLQVLLPTQRSQHSLETGVPGTETLVETRPCGAAAAGQQKNYEAYKHTRW